MSRIKSIFPIASANRVFDWLFGPRPPACFLLGKGIRVRVPRCGGCAKDLDLPRRHDETFMLAAPMADGRQGVAVNGSNAWLFFGTKVLVASVSSALAAVLDVSVAYFGEKVLVAMAFTAGANRKPLLLCRSCAANVLDKVNPPSQQYYSWDWLAELEPRGRQQASQAELEFPR